MLLRENFKLRILEENISRPAYHFEVFYTLATNHDISVKD